MEEDTVKRFLVLKRDGGDRLGYGKDDMEILHAAEQLGLPVFQPLRPRQRLAFGTSPMATAVVGDALMTAGVALFDMAAVRQRSMALMARSCPRLSESACTCR
jgi:hypothetical protein